MLGGLESDPQTEAIVMIGEIGGNAEQEAAAWAKENCSKPIVGFVGGGYCTSRKEDGARWSNHFWRKSARRGKVCSI